MTGFVEIKGKKGGLQRMKKRICIFSFYDKEGFVDDYVVYLLNELKTNVSRLIIVINGGVDDRGLKLFETFTSEVYIRDNTGYDAGAYRYVLCNCISSEELKSYDEVILCNDTFYGPLIPLRNIFEEMEKKRCDMWGLSGFSKIVFSHIQSYFLVFRENIIKKALLTEYFEKNIDETTVIINDVYCRFEVGLFDYLTRENHMVYDLYASECVLDVYSSSFRYLSLCGLPIVKKKTFSATERGMENIWCTLSYVKYNTRYDIELILKSIKRIYGIEISKEDIKHLEEYRLPQERLIFLPVVNDEQIKDFIGDDEFYIYGTGYMANNTYWRYARKKSKFKGFIVSDGQCLERNSLYGYPIYHFSEVNDIYDRKVILGIGNENTEQVLNLFDSKSNVLRIF